MSLSVAAAGGSGTVGTSVNSLSTPAHNQPAGNCIVVAILSYPNLTSAPTDTAGNSYVKVFSSDVMDAARNVWAMNFYYVPNCLGNSANVITFAATGITYGTISSWDIGGADPTSPLDAAIYNAGSSITSCPIGPYSTTVKDEVLISWLVNDYQMATNPTPPSGYTVDSYGVVDVLSCGATKIVSSLLSSETDTWTNINGTGSYFLPGFVLSFKAAPPVSGPVCVQSASTGTNNASSQNVAFPGDVTLGDLLIVQYFSESSSAGSPAISDSMGNVWAPLFNGQSGLGSCWHAAWYCLAKATGASTVFLTGGVSYCGINIAEFSGADTIDTQSYNPNVYCGGGPHFYVVSDPITTSHAACLIIVFGATEFFSGGGSGSFSSPVTFVVTQTDAWSEYGAQIGYHVVSSIQTGYTAQMATQDCGGSVAVVAFYAGGGAPPAPKNAIVCIMQ